MTPRNHPEWSAYLANRHILEQAIAAGAWIERSEYYGQDCLVWREKRRDGRPGARRRRFIDPPVMNGDKIGKSLWFPYEKTDEPFHYVGTLDELKQAIAEAGGRAYIVEGEIDVWSQHAIDIRNVIGIYGINYIPKDIAGIFDELGITKFVYFADNDTSGEQGASKLRTLLHESDWTGEGEYRQFAGPGIPEKGDANDLLCQYYPDLSAARAALAALPRLEPSIERKPPPKSSTTINYNDQRLDPIKEAVRRTLGVENFNRKGFSKKHFRCLDPQHDDPGPSANWHHKKGFCKCFGCGQIYNTIQTAEWLNIDWRALLKDQSSNGSSKSINLNAIPLTDAVPTPHSFEYAPDTWQTQINKTYTTTYATLLYFALRLRSAELLPEAFTVKDFINESRPLDNEVSERTIYNAFEEARDGNTHPVFAKIDPSEDSTSWNCKFRLRSLDDIRDRLLKAIRYRVHEEAFRQHPDIVIGYEVFAEAPLGSESAKALESALEPLYEEQEQRYEGLKRSCEESIAIYEAELADFHATPLPPNWKIKKPSQFPAGRARAIFDADPKARSRSQWAEQLGISKASVGDALDRAGIRRTPYTEKINVTSKHDLLTQARQRNVRIMAVGSDGGYQPYDAAMDITDGMTAFLQPTAKHEIVSDEQPILKPAPAKPPVSAPEENTKEPADNMKPPGNWYKASWDPQFIYWELVKACCLLHGYQVKDGVEIYDPQTGEVWRNPTVHDLVCLITGD